MRRLLALAALVVASPAVARDFTIGGEAFSEDDVVDARALPSMDGMPTILISFGDSAAQRLAVMTTRNVGKAVPIILDGKTLAEPLVQEPITGGAIEMNGFASLPDAIKLAKLISGKDPLPDSLEE